MIGNAHEGVLIFSNQKAFPIVSANDCDTDIHASSSLHGMPGFSFFMKESRDYGHQQAINFIKYSYSGSDTPCLKNNPCRKTQRTNPKITSG